MRVIDLSSGRKTEPGITIGLILATRHDKGYSHSFGPLGLGYLAASIRKELPGVRVVIREKLEELLAEKPDLVGISAQSETYSIAVRHARAVKESGDIPVIVGGVHISMLPESLDGCMDAGVIGEGEAAIVEILRSFLENGGLLPEALEKIPGLCFRVGGELRRTAPRELVTDLDRLPQPVLEELPFHVKSPTVCIVSARGCPYHCTFCISEKFAQRYRFMSAALVIDKIEELVRVHEAKHIVFYDDLLIANKKRLVALIGMLRERGLLGQVSFSCAVRANLVDDEICRLLRELNVTDLGMGVESFSDKILAYYNKSGVTAEKNQRAIDLLHSYGITVNPSIILAAPIETRDDMLVTLRKLFENLRDGKIFGPTWSTLIPYPGTKIWDYALERGIVGNDMDWDNYSSTLYKMYLCEELPLQQFGELMNEWIAKYTLLLIDHPERGGTFVTRDRMDLVRKIGSVYPAVAAREVPELGDELILALGTGDPEENPGELFSSPLPAVQPVLLPGEFVRPAMGVASGEGEAGGCRWEVAGTLSRGEVDTFLFAEFAYPEPLDLAHADWLEFESFVPEGQASSARLTALLQLSDGTEFIASTQRALDAAGCEKSVVFFHQFQVAPWSRTPEDSPGLRGTTRIRIGWGGYYGREGEQLRFALSPPRIGWVASPRLRELFAQ